MVTIIPRTGAIYAGIERDPRMLLGRIGAGNILLALREVKRNTQQRVTGGLNVLGYLETRRLNLRTAWCSARREKRTGDASKSRSTMPVFPGTRDACELATLRPLNGGKKQSHRTHRALRTELLAGANVFGTVNRDGWRWLVGRHFQPIFGSNCKPIIVHPRGLILRLTAKRIYKYACPADLPAIKASTGRATDTRAENYAGSQSI